MEHRSSSPVAATNQTRPALDTNQSSVSRAFDESSTRAPSAEAVSLLSQSSNTFDNQPVSPASISPTPPDQSGEVPTSTGASWKSPSSLREKNNQPQISATPVDVDTVRRASTLSQKYQRYVTGKWTWEIVSCLLAIATLIALAVTLSRYDGRPQPSLPYKVSINTLVSIFSTIIKALMLVSVAAGLGQLKWLWYEKPRPLQNFSHFDQAAQGPLGATKLLWILRLKHLASLGAFIMVIAIALDPFTQAVLHLYSCNVILPTKNATIPRSNNYTTSGAHQGGSSLESTLNQPMQNAIYTGIYNSANASQTSFECSSGNCTFPTYEDISYQSLGICSQCVDVSEKLSINCTDACKVSLSTIPNQKLENSQLLVIYPFSYEQYDIASLPPESTIGHFSLMMQNASYVDTYHLTDSVEAFFAVECALYACVKSYNATVTGGTLDETIVDIALDLESYNAVNGSYIVPSPCVINGSVINGTDLQGDHPNDDAWQQMTLNGSSTYVLKKCVYGIGGSSWTSIQDFIDSIATGDVEGADAVGYTASPTWLSVIYDSGNATVDSINQVIAGIATSMTTFIRQNGEAGNSNPAYGVVYGTETCVNVQWGWIAFPAAAVALTALFLVITILKSRRHPGQLVWKSEILPVLYHGLDPQLRDRAGLADNAEDMDHYSSSTTVHLKRTETGWRFVDSQEHPEIIDVSENGGNRGV